MAKFRSIGAVVGMAGVVTAVGMATLGAQGVHAQAFPNRPISLVYPFPAGNVLDVSLRAVSAEASKMLGQPIVFENRPGAKTRLGVAAIAKAPPDGHQLSVAIDALMVGQPIADPDFKMVAGKDYAPVAFVLEFPYLLAASALVPFRDIAGMISYAKANPGKLNIAVAPGSASHFATERLLQTAGVGMTLIPYKGGDMANDLVAGRIDLAFTTTLMAPFINTGKAVALGTTGTQRWHAFPTVPTFAEAGLPMPTTVWFAIIAHANTPPDIVARLNSVFTAAVNLPHIQKQLAANGYNTDRKMSPAELTAFIQSELNVWGPVIQKAGIKLD
jgi:tripartite-type tricarboxylate transporter receptor subunit TctC